MPELAEVQTIVDGLQRLVGQRLQAVELRYPEWVERGSLDSLIGERVEGVRRWGKRLAFAFDAGIAVVSLGMTGGFRLPAANHEPEQHEVCRLAFERDVASYVDPRRFGSCLVFSDRDTAEQALSDRIGPDGAGPWTWRDLEGWMGSRRAAIKAVLLDQGTISALGNYLVDEMCGLARVAPQRRADSLSRSEWVRLNRSRMQVICRALETRGLTFSDYRTVDGERGQMQSSLRFYGREGLPCVHCATPLVKGVVAGRGTVWCPTCQPAPTA